MVTPAYVRLPQNRTMVPAVSYELDIKIIAPPESKSLSKAFVILIVVLSILCCLAVCLGTLILIGRKKLTKKVLHQTPDETLEEKKRKKMQKEEELVRAQVQAEFKLRKGFKSDPEDAPFSSTTASRQYGSEKEGGRLNLQSKGNDLETIQELNGRNSNQEEDKLTESDRGELRSKKKNNMFLAMDPKQMAKTAY